MWDHSFVVGYSGTPLVRKLGITAGSRVLLDGVPSGFRLDGLPEGAVVSRRLSDGPYDVIVCFCTNSARLRARWPVLHRLTTPAGALWIAWPKRSSKMLTDLDENTVRAYALRNGRVDVKVCAIDHTWSALKHVVRRAERVH